MVLLILEAFKETFINSGIIVVVFNLIVQIFVVLLVYFGGSYLRKLRKHLDERVRHETAQSAVKYVEQVFTTLGSSEKFEEAKNKLILLLEEKGIGITDTDVRVLIEEAVYELNEEKNEGIIDIDEDMKKYEK